MPDLTKRMLASAHSTNRCASVRVLVEVPFTASDVPRVLRTLSLWSHFLPCTSTAGNRVAGLLFLYNGRCGDTNGGLDACERVRQLAQTLGTVQHCFSDVHIRDARLSSRADTYDKQRRSARWSAGPNNLFYRAVAVARHLGYTHMLQMEPDVVPFRSGWLDHASCLAAFSEAWVIGSALQANCTREETTGKCVDLPDDIAEHINGNAIYAVGDETFINYLSETRRGRFGRLPFDLALHTVRNHYSQSARRLLLHRFQHSTFVLNFGTSMPDQVATIRSQHTSAFLIHSSALASVDAQVLQAHLSADLSMPLEKPIESKAANDLRRRRNLDLSPLVQRAATLGSERIIVLTFLAGYRYRTLCRNHVIHLNRAGVVNYVLVALDASSLRWLRAEREPVVDATRLVDSVPEAGADRFGSSAFFAINGARYHALLAILQAGISVFVVDLDVVVLMDPLSWLAQRTASSRGDLLNAELLVQSDARDGTSGLELDPDLLERRLGLRGTRNWTYANGGTFYCRAAPTTVAFFESVWQQLSSSHSIPNEQDMLNRELAVNGPSGRLRWGLLPPTEFPNGFVYFFRPVVGMKPVLVHANWVNGVEQKVYHLQEVGLWKSDNKGAGADDNRLLSIGDGTDSGPGGRLSFASHRRAFRDALAFAQALNRTLVLPHLPVSRTSNVSARTLAHFFDYESFSRAFPRHRTQGSLQDALKENAVKVHLDVGRGDGPPSGSDFAIVRVRTPATVDGLSDVGIQKHLAPYADARVLHLWTPYRRFNGRFATRTNAHAKPDFSMRAQHGLRPAPRLHFLVQHLHRLVRRVASSGFDCVDASIDQDFATSLSADGSSGVQMASMHALLRVAAQALNATHVLVISDNDGATRKALRQEASAVLGARTLWMDDHVPPWYLTDFDMPSESATHAHSMAEMRLCARAQRFIGSLAAPSTHAICRLRRSTSGAGSRNGHTPACRDAFGRTLPTKWVLF